MQAVEALSCSVCCRPNSANAADVRGVWELAVSEKGPTAAHPQATLSPPLPFSHTLDPPCRLNGDLSVALLLLAHYHNAGSERQSTAPTPDPCRVVTVTSRRYHWTPCLCPSVHDALFGLRVFGPLSSPFALPRLLPCFRRLVQPDRAHNGRQGGILRVSSQRSLRASARVLTASRFCR